MSRGLIRHCWCGNDQLEVFSDGYWRCARCGTLVSSFEHGRDVSRVQADDRDLYGKDYWFGHMESDLGFSNIYQRARTDLTERCPHWLQTLLKYKRPPARVLELGAAHGGFVAMLRWAGYDAVGLELSPAIVQIARDLFDVPMLQGPIEDQSIAPGSLDVVVLMDVLEHLPDPLGTVRCALQLLKPDGLLLIQTPNYPEGQSLPMMQAAGDRFIEMLKSNEHLYLFSTRSVRRLFAEAAFEHFAFENALFNHYDMFFVVSGMPLKPSSSLDREERLIAAPVGRLVLAVLDLADQARVERDRFRQADDDRTHRLTALNALHETLRVAESDRAARLKAIETLTVQLTISEQDRAARLDVIERAQARIDQLAEENVRLRQSVGERP